MKILEGKTQEYQNWVDAQNGDSYGLGIFQFAELWATKMEEEIARGRSLANCAKDCADWADEQPGMGITGFMYGAAVSVLAQCWEHGEDLRRWHNIATQVGSEGERANENGTTLNPALLEFRG